MAFRDNPIGLLIRTDADAAASKISDALAKADGFLEPTAKALDVDRATLRRWIRKLREMKRHVAPLRGRGWILGRERGTKVDAEPDPGTRPRRTSRPAPAPAKKPRKKRSSKK